MAFGETLTLLATLANAYQALRANRGTDAPGDPPPVIDPALLIALDAVKAANDDTIRRHQAASNGAHLLIGLSAATVLLSAFLGAVRPDAADASSPLFLASVGTFLAVTLSAILLRRVFALETPLLLLAALQVVLAAVWLIE